MRGTSLESHDDLDPVLVGEPLWTLQKDGHSAEARVRAIAGIGLELRFSIVGTAGASCAGKARGLRREGLARAIVYQLASAQAPSTEAKIRSELLRGAKTVKQLAGALGVSPQTINRTLEDMAGEAIQVGKAGTKKNAVLFGLREKGTLPSQSLRDGEVESSDLDPLAA